MEASAKRRRLGPGVAATAAAAAAATSDDDFDACDLPSDTLAAIHLLMARASPVMPVPIVLVHELYSVVDNRTEVDRELHELLGRGTIALVRLPCAHSNKAIVFRNAYAAHVRARLEAAGARTAEHGSSSAGGGTSKTSILDAPTAVATAALRRFLAHLPECCEELSIGAHRLRELLAAELVPADGTSRLGHALDANACVRYAQPGTAERFQHHSLLTPPSPSTFRFHLSSQSIQSALPGRRPGCKARQPHP
jgi:hypothetical protein